MDFSFDDFNWTIVSGGAPYVTISSLGIAFNSVSIDKLGSPEKIIIGFNQDKLTLAIKPYEDEANLKPYIFASRVRNNWIRIGCKDFIKFLSAVSNIDYSTSKKYVAECPPNSNVLIVNILDDMENDEEEENWDEK